MSVFFGNNNENENDGDFLDGLALKKEDDLSFTDLGFIDERESLIHLSKVFDEYEKEQKNRDAVSFF